MMEVPSTGTPFVTTRTSPGRAPPVVTSRALSTSPSMVPTTMGRSSPGVTSVWPPTSATPWAWHAAPSWAKSVVTSASVVRPSGRRHVARNHRGTAPRTARSLALTTSAYQPRSSVTNVIGSVVATK